MAIQNNRQVCQNLLLKMNGFYTKMRGFYCMKIKALIITLLFFFSLDEVLLHLTEADVSFCDGNFSLSAEFLFNYMR